MGVTVCGASFVSILLLGLMFLMVRGEITGSNRNEASSGQSSSNSITGEEEELERQTDFLSRGSVPHASSSSRNHRHRADSTSNNNWSDTNAYTSSPVSTPRQVPCQVEIQVVKRVVGFCLKVFGNRKACKTPDFLSFSAPECYNA